MYTSEILRSKFITFFENRKHAVISSASLIPENDPSSLFITAGMQPLVPYLLGKPHPKGKRLVDVQKCVRTGDIDDVGDNRHLTFFEMLGNWSLGDYFKEESISWSLEFLISKDEGLGIDINRLYVTTFRGEDGIPRDEDSINIWKREFARYGKKVEVSDNEEVSDQKRIIPLGVDDNFWIAGNSGPCGSDTEIFYDTRPHEGELVGTFTENVDSFRLIEIWNNVFMEFNKTDKGFYEPLENKNVDTGMGLERTLAVLSGVETVFEIDTFKKIITEIRKHEDCTRTEEHKNLSERIIADHIRTATFMIMDGVIPSNSEQGYILRRILRRAIRYADLLGLPPGKLSEISKSAVVPQYKDFYSELSIHEDKIIEEINKEESKFRKTLSKGLALLNKYIEMQPVAYWEEGDGINYPSLPGDNKLQLPSKLAFDLYQTHGFPLELISEEVGLRGMVINRVELDDLFKQHQESSRQGSENRFKGGLSDTGEMTTKYHTATHLLNAALRKVLGNHVEQRGSANTPDRLRFDFSHPQKLTDEEKNNIEILVNSWINQDLNVTQQTLNKDEAFKQGAIGVFVDKYGDEVSVYSIKDDANIISMELCGGPHIQHTGQLGTFKIIKEESVAQGVRRIKAVLE